MKFTRSDKLAGEMAISRLSKDAQNAYYGTYPLEVFKVDDDDAVYYIRDVAGTMRVGTLKDLDELLSAMWKETAALEADDEE